ncbi:MAG: hypothetical protein ABSG05_01340 [Candidatus Pacearchaeota archaeon]|jgi:hypothetical protein
MGNELKFKISDFRPVTGYADYVKRNAGNIDSESSYNSKEMFLLSYNLSLLAAGVVIITGLEKILQ